MLISTKLVLVVVALCHSAYGSNSPLIKKIHGPGVHYEGPHWSPTESSLYWVDIKGQQVHRLDGSTGNVTTRSIGYGPVTPVVSVKDSPGYLVLCVRTELYLVRWKTFVDDGALRLLGVMDLGLPDNRCNDGKADARGRLWVGTMGKEEKDVDPDQGALYMVDQDNHADPEVKVRPVSVSNGLAWTRSNKYMFYIDTPTRNIDVFDFDLDTGMIRNRRTIFSFESNNVTGLPDGMTIDTDGNLWIACFNGGKVIKVNSVSGKLIEQHKIPASKVTSVMFGGPELSILYITTSRVGLSATQLAQQPEAGSLFAIQGTGAKGYPENQFVFPGAERY
ncbi:regucalcin [Plutella xylostella]|uniref:regucalcin n=1 Tax=Plutella xylostella TaxID=51655 RepID=UPI002032B9FC|nr:regucalcin [Plutella xylostella]